MKKTLFPCKMNATRKGIIDLWNSRMVANTTFSKNDIPLCPTTAKQIPEKLIGYDEAKTIHRRHINAGKKDYHINAFIHFFIDDYKFDGPCNSIWLHPENTFEIIQHFSGMIAPDFSTCVDFPDPLKRWNIYRMCAFGSWIASQNIPVISNVRWGSEETWTYCFDGNPYNSMIAIGTIASGLRSIQNRPLFENGLFYMVEKLRPHTILVYGSANYTCFEKLKSLGITVISFKSRTNAQFGGDRYE